MFPNEEWAPNMGLSMRVRYEKCFSKLRFEIHVLRLDPHRNPIHDFSKLFCQLIFAIQTVILWDMEYREMALWLSANSSTNLRDTHKTHRTSSVTIIKTSRPTPMCGEIRARQLAKPFGNGRACHRRAVDGLGAQMASHTRSSCERR